MIEAIEEFLTAGQAGGWSRATVEQYRWHLLRWAAWLAGREVLRLEQISRSELRAYAAEQSDQYAPATRRISGIAVRSFLRWCDEEKLLPGGMELATAIRLPRVPLREQRTVDDDDVRALLRSCDEPVRWGLSAKDAEATRLRNGAMVALLFDSLLRAGELCRLRLGDVDFQRQTVLVQGKGGKRQRVRFGSDTAERLARWIQTRQTIATCDALFVGVGGRHPGTGITTEGLRAILRALERRAGVQPASPHAFRRGGAVQALVNGAPSRAVQMHARWDDIRMIERYTQTLDAAAMFDHFSPMDGLRNGGS